MYHFRTEDALWRRLRPLPLSPYFTYVSSSYVLFEELTKGFHHREEWWNRGSPWCVYCSQRNRVDHFEKYHFGYPVSPNFLKPILIEVPVNMFIYLLIILLAYISCFVLHFFNSQIKVLFAIKWIRDLWWGRYNILILIDNDMFLYAFR